MTVRDFFFALEFTDQAASPQLLTELASCVLTHVGSPEESKADVTGPLLEAVAKSAASGERRFDIHFQAHDGLLEIHVSSNGGPIWQTTRPIA